MYDKASWPETGDLVLGTVTRIVRHGAYITLDEYDGKEGLIHISEISSTWVKNIRDHVRERQKTVLKVLRVDADREHVDLSLRRVTGKERKEKLLEWKHSKKAEVIIKMAAEKKGVSLEEAYDKVGFKMEKHYGDLYSGFEEAVDKGEEALTKAGVSRGWAKILAEVARAKIKVSKVSVRGTLELTCPKPDGVNVIRDAFIQASKVKKPKGTGVRIYVVGAPKYRIEVSAGSYKEAERLLETAVKTAIKNVKTAGGEGKFERET